MDKLEEWIARTIKVAMGDHPALADLADQELRGRYNQLRMKSAPIPQSLCDYVDTPKKRSRHRPVRYPLYVVSVYLWGPEVEKRLSNGTKYEVAIREVRDTFPFKLTKGFNSKPSIASIKAAHTLFRREKGLRPRRGGKMKRQLSK